MRSEFDFIQNIKKKYDLKYVGDDCAVLPKDAQTDMVITADMMVEGIDFRLDWTTPEFLGHKALAVSLSDIAAMGAKPVWAMLSIGIPENVWSSDFIDRFYDGWHRLARRYSLELVGGDVSKTPEKIVIDSIVAGEVLKGKAILRSGAEAGNAIIVTGDLGGSAGGLKLLIGCERLGDNDDSWQGTLLLKHLQPWPQVGTGIYLQLHDIADSMIDLSDGLSSDLSHICKMSSVGAQLIAEKVPVNLNLRKLAGSFDEELDLALNGGEDFELLFTANQEKLSQLDERIFRIIGEVTANIGIIELIRDGKTEILEPKGYRHF